MSKRALRRTTMRGWGWCEAKPRWTGSTIEFGVWKSDVKHEVILEIDDPWALAEIRRELQKIEDYWRNQLPKAGAP